MILDSSIDKFGEHFMNKDHETQLLLKFKIAIFSMKCLFLYNKLFKN